MRTPRKRLTPRAKTFLSITFAALIVAGYYTVGCQNSDSVSNPPQAQQTPVPTSANQHAQNGKDLGPAIAAQNRHTDELLAIDGVIGTGAGLHSDGTPAVFIFTKRANVSGLPSQVDGIHTRIENIGEVKAFGYSGSSQAPTRSGYSVGNNKECAAGTIGCVVTDGTKNYLLSNNHVFARVNKAQIGEAIDQPGLYDAIPQCTGTVTHGANLSKFIPINFRRNAKNTVDCAIAELAAGITATSASAGGYTPTSVVEAATVGLAVEKSGRTTGTTTGSVAAINVTISVSYGNGQTAKFVGQIYFSSTTFSAAGDSGSLIVDSGSFNPVGLLFAGSASSTIANPIGDVLSALGVRIVSQ